MSEVDTVAMRSIKTKIPTISNRTNLLTQIVSLVIKETAQLIGTVAEKQLPVPRGIPSVVHVGKTLPGLPLLLLHALIGCHYLQWPAMETAEVKVVHVTVLGVDKVP